MNEGSERLVAPAVGRVVGDDEARRREARRFRVATYNVRRCIGTDGVCDVGRVGRVITEIDADVVALQELSFRELPRGIDQLERLAGMNGYHFERCAVHETPEGTIGLGLLCRERPLSSRRVDLSFESFEPRAALSACFRLAGAKVRIVATHLGLRWRERRYQATLLAEELTRSGDEDVRILVGDLNDWIPGSPNLAVLEGVVAKASWGAATFPSWLPLLSLDEIWVSPNQALLERRALRSSSARRASDHLPLLAEVDVSVLSGRAG